MSRTYLHRAQDEFIPDAQIQCYMNAADLVAMPYSDILNSGSALLALSLHRPILVTNKAPMRELAQLAGADWVQLFDNPLHDDILTAPHWTGPVRTTGRAVWPSSGASGRAWPTK